MVWKAMSTASTLARKKISNHLVKLGKDLRLSYKISDCSKLHRSSILCRARIAYAKLSATRTFSKRLASIE